MAVLRLLNNNGHRVLQFANNSLADLAPPPCKFGSVAQAKGNAFFTSWGSQRLNFERVASAATS